MVGSIRIGVAKDLPGVYQARQPLFRELDLVSQRDGLTFDCQYRHRAAYGRGKKQRTVALDREPLRMMVDLDLAMTLGGVAGKSTTCRKVSRMTFFPCSSPE
jgi:hypothetical protein